MRTQLDRLRRGKSTKAERRFAEILKVECVPFKTKVLIQGREIDFLIGKYAIEIDSHPQDLQKNIMLVRAGYIPLHLPSWGIGPHLNEWVKKLWQEQVQVQISSPQSQLTRM